MRPCSSCCEFISSAIIVLSFFWVSLWIGSDVFASGNDLEYVQYSHWPGTSDADAAWRVRQWRKLLTGSTHLQTTAKLERVNLFVNQLRFRSDIQQWGKLDYWATPLEFLQAGAGDCEDFAITKYFSLLQLGIPAQNLRLVYVHSHPLNQAHMVLAYYPSPTSDPILLDNLQETLSKASQRSDLLPIYSFDVEKLWLARRFGGSGQMVGLSNRIGNWQSLLLRLKQLPKSTSSILMDLPFSP